MDPVYFLILILSTRLCYVYVCSQFNLSSKSLQTCFFVQGFSLSGLNRFILGFYQTSLFHFIMPGHDHSLVPKLNPGDLGTREAFFLWNCPIKDEDSQSDNTLSSKYNRLYLRGGYRQHNSKLFSYIRSVLADNFPFSLIEYFRNMRT